MDSTQLMKILPMTLIMICWLSLVLITVILSFKKSKQTEGLIKKQYLYIGISSIIIIIGDSLHTIGYDLAILTGDPTGPWDLLGNFPVKTFAMFADDLAFMIFYLFWLLLIVARYQEGKFELYDKVVIIIAIFAIITILPGAIPNFMGIYTLDYIISIFAIHNILFITFGALTVAKLIFKSNEALRIDDKQIIQNKAYLYIGICFIFSYLFFFLTLTLIPINSAFGILMLPKTVAYVIAYILILRRVVMIPILSS